MTPGCRATGGGTRTSQTPGFRANEGMATCSSPGFRVSSAAQPLCNPGLQGLRGWYTNCPVAGPTRNTSWATAPGARKCAPRAPLAHQTPATQPAARKQRPGEVPSTRQRTVHGRPMAALQHVRWRPTGPRRGACHGETLGSGQAARRMDTLLGICPLPWPPRSLPVAALAGVGGQDSVVRCAGPGYKEG